MRSSPFRISFPVISRRPNHGRVWRPPLCLAAIILLLAASVLPASRTHADTSSVVGPKTYYLVLGDAGAFGYQPNHDWTHGYANQWFAELQTHGVKRLVNYACMGEDSTTFISGDCPFRALRKIPYSGSQLSAAVSFIRAHPGQVSPVSLDIGADDGLKALWPRRSCNVIPYLWEQHLATLDENFTTVILPALVGALTDANGRRTGDLILVNNFNPGQNVCPDQDVYLKELNAHLAADMAQFNLPVADVYSPFNSGPLPNEKLCTYTWICAIDKVGHATGGQPGEPDHGYGVGNGYGVEAQVLEQTLGY